MNQSKNTKEHILDVSLKLFSEKTYYGASIRDIAKAIDKRESSIYNHFKSKEEIFEQLILKFSSRNFGPLILTDQLINIISKPEKFFILLSENLIHFWNSEEERMFIKILLAKNSNGESKKYYSIENYLNDFKALSEFIFREMISHKFIKKMDVVVLSQEFISPLFLAAIELILGLKSETIQKSLIKNHVEFFWNSVKK
ncbi:MAG: TetR/AcrR family transcriptional regulator [Ignavibacteriae bacterium]|nr:TetR/AcrR family transcriptional regulator [Ignavibacteriota bacterium]MCB9207821.1 TetR/AcrR family transcriptional regulator [Ignavibacteriales bacterium]MCB9258590.1 TetR/AcrR family transcriptional regulator [Ignavibacteriales bacterium]